jgi:sugar/nucleoside kinase (ribokinase family)
MGELNPDLILSDYSSFPEPGKEVVVEDCTLTMGSAGAICAMGLAKLGNRVGFVSKVGADTYGDFCLGILRNAGIDTTGVDRDPASKTGITVSVSSSRDRALISFLGATLEQEGACITPAFLSGYQHLHITSFFLQPRMRARLGEILTMATAQGLTTSLDPGFDPAERWDGGLHEVLRQIDVFLPNAVEIAGVSGEQDPVRGIARLQNGRTLTVAKLGAAGCVTVSDGQCYRATAFPVHPVDTTGAGDTFNAGFLHCWLRRRPMAECLRFASACGAISTLAPGGTGSQPTEQEALDFLERHREIV